MIFLSTIQSLGHKKAAKAFAAALCTSTGTLANSDREKNALKTLRYLIQDVKNNLLNKLPDNGEFFDTGLQFLAAKNQLRPIEHAFIDPTKEQKILAQKLQAFFEQIKINEGENYSLQFQFYFATHLESISKNWKTAPSNRSDLSKETLGLITLWASQYPKRSLQSGFDELPILEQHDEQEKVAPYSASSEGNSKHYYNIKNKNWNKEKVSKTLAAAILTKIAETTDLKHIIERYREFLQFQVNQIITAEDNDQTLVNFAPWADFKNNHSDFIKQAKTFHSALKAKLTPDSPEKFFQIILLSAADIDHALYKSHNAIEFACELLNECLQLFYTLSKQELTRSYLEKIKEQAADFPKNFDIPYGETSTNIKAFTKADIEIVDAFIKYPLSYLSEVATHIVISRFTILQPKKDIEQFLFEMYGYYYSETSDVPEYLQKRMSKLLPDLKNFEKIETKNFVDGPNSPMQALARISACLLQGSVSLYKAFSLGIILNIHEKFIDLRKQNKPIINICEVPSNIRMTIDSLCSNFEGINSIWIGSRVEDIYWELKHQKEQEHDFSIKSTKANEAYNSIKKSHDKLKKQNQEIESQLNSLVEQIQASDLDNTQLKQTIEKLKTEQIESLELLKIADEENNELISDIQNLQEEINALQYKNANILRRSLFAPGNDSFELNTLIEKIESSGLNPTTCLMLTKFLGGDRVVVTDSAIRSAKEIDKDFALSDKLLMNLIKLVFSYRDTYFEKGDSQAKNVFSNNIYASGESDTVQSSSSSKKQREVFYNGKIIACMPHLRIGNSNGQTSIRVHFAQDPEEKKIIIGHCGIHLKNKHTS